MKPFWIALILGGWLAAILPAQAAPQIESPPVALSAPVAATLTTGTKALLRIRQVIPADGLSRAERVLNGLPPLQKGDVFTAEVMEPACHPPLIIAGCVESVTPPRRFARPGNVSVKFAWPLDSTGEHPGQWQFNVEDQRFSSAQRRRAITTLLVLEGIILGASVGTTLDRGKSAVTLGGVGVGLLIGVAYASLQPGQAASLEPGDTLSVIVGTTAAKKLPPEAPLHLFPAQEPEKNKHRRKNP
ncbi:MAG: hypothetical protein LC104_04680 [Bacteroidales bacterium]|nr:hypothetical protein [Bacteroidales bacterium]